MIRLLVADDQPAAREGLRLLFGAAPDVTVVGAAAHGIELVAMARRLRPDVVLTDIRMPGMDGVAAARDLARLDPAPPTIMLTTFDLDEYLFGALQAGAVGFLLKESEPELYVTAVRAAARGEGVIDPRVTPRLVDRFARTSPRTPPHRAQELTDREREVLRLVARGHGNALIGRELGITPGTAKVHVARILTKLGVASRVQAAVFAYRYGLVTWSDTVEEP
ncbi:response regulator transcription factor [Nocardiopsis dassonvillei]|uniref:Response regulator transcription factor n=1 Tax=Nocardiopsis alborubida TaxID=146802 RepID=A0A7X6MAW4_9ACTN|nr:response regulator transcription factor [Nocardiopsis alborubida]NKY97872.1 response regulator transcription factor [Nocardiopsis alborubida]